MAIKKTNNNSGFTVVEVIVVVALIGMLAALTIVGYTTWQKYTAETSVKSDLKAVMTAMKNARNFSSGYPLSIPSSFISSEHVEVSYYSGDATSFCIDGVSTLNATVSYYINATGAIMPTAGNCSGQVAVVLPPDPGPEAPPADPETPPPAPAPTYTESQVIGFCTSPSTVPAGYNVIKASGAGSQTLYGTAGNDLVCGLSSNDTLYGYGGDDILHGGSGSDKIYGGPGNDILVGASASDELYGEDGNDILYGGSGVGDKLNGGNGNDRGNDPNSATTYTSVEVTF